MEVAKTEDDDMNLLVEKGASVNFSKLERSR
jgi:hypothetical protein